MAQDPEWKNLPYKSKSSFSSAREKVEVNKRVIWMAESLRFGVVMG
jgi:hypothetical protein